MFGLIRVGAYFVSAVTMWSFFHDDIGRIADFSLPKHLVLDPAHGMILGVCAGIGNYTSIDVTVIRFAWVVATLYRGFGVLLYILAFLIMPTPG